jgi:phosphatidylserine/phosphatidylglycerophosphate/cardiolipin synthase-like enzyme
MLPQNSENHLYCTWSYRKSLPAGTRSQFRDLDHFVRTLCSSAREQVVMVAPYLSPTGLAGLRDSLAASAERGAWIRLLTGDLGDPRGRNRRSLSALVEGERGSVVRTRLRVLTATERLPALIHAKIILADQQTGYLGSANFSQSAMDSNFELGVALCTPQVRALESLLAFFEAENLITDCTADVLSG